MTVRKLDHVNIRTPRLEETVKFYSDVVGLTVGRSPGGGMGAWLCDERGEAVIHLGSTGPNRLPGDDASRPTPTEGSGVVHHVAFECADCDAFTEKLERLGVAFERSEVASLNLRQIFLRDPNHILVELNFRG